MSLVESEITPAESSAPSSPEEWREANLEATLHTIVENMVLRSESEKVVLHALIDNLDTNPEDVIAKLEIAPINTGGGGYVDPVTAQILADNAALRNDVRELLDALKNGNQNAPVVEQAEKDIDETVTTPPAQVQQNTPVEPVQPIQTAPAPAPAPVPAPVDGGANQ